LTQDARDHGLRLGSYGDPMAVPSEVWIDLIDALMPRSVVGYTHQWRDLSIGDRAWFEQNVMASADSITDATLARDLGWRVFLATPTGTTVPDRFVLCPATRDEDPLTCRQCGICNGTQGKATRASVYLWEHGMRSQSKGKRSAALAVLA
jgi:hypothetical protein